HPGPTAGLPEVPGDLRSGRVARSGDRATTEALGQRVCARAMQSIFRRPGLPRDTPGVSNLAPLPPAPLPRSGGEGRRRSATASAGLVTATVESLSTTIMDFP